MFFVLRCTFWLSLVYASILWPNSLTLFGAKGDRQASVQPPAISVDRVLTDAGDYCVRHAADCMAGAVRLTALLDATRVGVGGGRDTSSSVVASHGGTVPLPVRDPRRAVR